MTDADKITLIREEMPAVTNRVYLNTGTCGPLSSITIEAINQANAVELADGRADLGGFKLVAQTLTETRAALARLVKADPAQIALTHHTTEGMNIVAHGLVWQPGEPVA